ncbi:MAG: FkbM family methyltransferase [Gammaproteobacteria bacterium]|nr:FkbM family methyltransferase [Gammaproteobacteria bacterium]MBV9621524.1 FkbM family methyltransferase [Gammaproteobacteria bacterium]
MAPEARGHAWPLRALRTVQFGLARLRGAQVEAQAAPFGLRFVGPAADCITRGIYRRGVHEPLITRYLLEAVRLGPGDVAIDAGANIGWYSLLLDRLAEPGASVYAFEPEPATFALLQVNLARNRATHVEPVPAALGAAAGRALLRRYKDSNNGRHSLLAAESGAGSVEVPVLTLDSFWEQRGLAARPLRVLKIDVEGFEYFVLQGARALLPRCERLLLEFAPTSPGADGRAGVELLALMRAHGFLARAFTPRGLVPLADAELAGLRTRCDLLFERHGP